ncbi:MAG: hypothetical protein AAGJ93_01085 [Bacteroidota bacterium]
MTDWVVSSKKKLFLVCPTDHMEMLIREKFHGESFFCTALGLYFELDERTQYKLWELIAENNIEQLLFVSRLNNIFYQQAFSDKPQYNYSVSLALAKTRRNLASQSSLKMEAFPNLHRLAAQHIVNQQMRLLASSYLGNHLITRNIEVNACLYQASQQIFYSLSEVEQRGNLLSNISAN